MKAAAYALMALLLVPLVVVEIIEAVAGWIAARLTAAGFRVADYIDSKDAP